MTPPTTLSTVLLLQFTDFANQMLAVYRVNARTIFDSYTNFAVAVSAAALSAGAEWPFYSHHGWVVQAARFLEQSGARSIGIAHIVTPEDYDPWIRYTQANLGWKQELHEFYGKEGPLPPVASYIMESYPFSSPPIEEPAPAEGYDFFLPIWESSPIESDGRPSLTNYDVLRFVVTAKRLVTVGVLVDVPLLTLHHSFL